MHSYEVTTLVHLNLTVHVSAASEDDALRQVAAWDDKALRNVLANVRTDDVALVDPTDVRPV